jgi:CubicO group peptidase (beta-lactamase class C family)
MRVRVAVLGVLVLVTSGRPSAAQVSADTAAMIDRVLTAINRTDAPGCALGVNRNAQPLYRHGYGMASLETRAPMTEYSVVESGSVAKQFTAAAIAHLALQGKLGLDDEVQKHIPELPRYQTPVTVRMMLHHTSGVRDMWTLFNLAGEAPGTNLYTMDQALRMVYRQKELNFPSNSEFLYSNSGYLLLAELVERVSGIPLSKYSQEHFFKPLGMTQTQWRDDWNRVVPGRVTAYSPIPGGGVRVDMPFMSVYGAGGLFSTVGDLLIWNDNLDNPRVGGKAWADTLQRRGRLTGGREIDYALGLFMTSYRGEKEVSHGGATGGYRTFLGRWPERKLSIAVLCNAANANPDNLAHQVADVFIGPRPTTTANAGAGSGPTVPDAATFAGRYRDPQSETLLAFAARDGRLVLDLGSRPALVPAGPDRFDAPGGRKLTFHRGADGKVIGLTMVDSENDTTRYETVAGPPSTAAELAPLAGSYYSEELAVTYVISAKDTTLSLQVADRPVRPLARIGRDSFNQPGAGAVRFIRGKGGKVDGFLLFAGRVKNLRFTKR